MTKVNKLPLDTKLQSQMLNYIVRVIDSKGEIVEVWQYEGYSGNSMWDIVCDFRHAFPKEKGFTIEW